MKGRNILVILALLFLVNVQVGEARETQPQEVESTETMQLAVPDRSTTKDPAGEIVEVLQVDCSARNGAVYCECWQNDRNPTCIDDFLALYSEFREDMSCDGRWAGTDDGIHMYMTCD